MRGLKNIAGLFGGTKLSKWVYGSAAALALAAVPAVSQAAPGPLHRDDDHRVADHHDFDRGHDRDHDHGGFGVDVRIGSAPRYVTREVQVWIPAVYRTDCVQVWVPDVFEDRPVTFRGDHGRIRTRIQHVLVTPGHFETRDTQVLVTPGHYETHVEQVPVDDGGVGFRIHG
jgi:hypothetical protein